jgi:DNA gyrase inhibitor GyrI
LSIDRDEEDHVDELDVKIVELPPMRVARAHFYGTQPETGAFNKLLSWAREEGLLADGEAHRVFGFNNPDPSPGSPNYGYEFWMTVGPEVEGSDEIEIRSFAGGLYAVARCETEDQEERIGEGWQALIAWMEGSRYRPAHHQWLEEHIGDLEEDEPLILDLYCPIAE